ncbi:MAG: IS5 family transposase [Dehalococcoidia bacterium]|nr:IS5 family transposase [Dehalococcoidia bacterium]
MRGDDDRQAEMLIALTPDQLVPTDHPIRRIKPVVEAVLARLSPLFDEMYATRGRPSIPPEHLLKASLLIALFSVRSERQFCERLQYDLLFKWFLDLNVGDRSFNPTTFSKNRERLLRHRVADAFFAEVVAEAQRRQLLSSEHFTVDGTLLEAWASLKSYRPRDGQDPPTGGGRNAEVDFRGQRRRRETHASTTDPEARLYTKGSGQAAKLCYLGHVLTENRHGLVVDAELTVAGGYAERTAALAMLDRRRGRKQATLGADRGYDTRDFVAGLRERGVTPHVAQNDRNRRSAVDGRTTRHPGYAVSQRRRKRVEEVFGWGKTVGGLRKLRYVGRARNELCFKLTAAAYNLVRMAKLETMTA